MAKTTIRHAMLAALCVAATVLGLAAVDPAPHPPDAGDAPSAEPQRGQLLIASAHIQDPRFYHAVVLLLRHNQDGAFGIIVNHPIADEPVAALLAATGDDDTSVEGTISVVTGGPVQLERGFVVHSAEYRRAETMAVDGKVAMTASKEALRDIGHHRGPKKYFFAFGYAGWGPGQLEGEMARRDWFAVPEDADLVFDDDRSQVWDHALARRGQEL
ncbi:MAG TPA: YqgE/AlgH family protein [Stellaceae bacterium]|nr:YqgE/AlgH family protein [Stellaceae bacterium]